MSASDVYLHVLERVDVTAPGARPPPGIEPWQLDLARLWLLSGEVLNGGIAQYFVNSSGDAAEAACEGARRLGFPVVADRLAEAMARFGAPYPADQAERYARWPNGAVTGESMLRQFARLDEAFHDLDRGLAEVLEIEDALDAVVTAHTRGA